jgi:alkylated DNA repair protein (DNA oxidative demethylase)
MIEDLFDNGLLEPRCEVLADGASVLRGFALAGASELLKSIAAIAELSPFRHLLTPRGLRMSVAMTNCGVLGWVSDRRGYRYEAVDPKTGSGWPPMPQRFIDLAHSAAEAAGFPEFEPDACLINRYVPGARLTLHQDRDERDFSAPIVSVSLGIAATFLLGGDSRKDPQQRIQLQHGDVVVWGGASRLRHHGILPLRENSHPLTGECRYNLTFRKAG